MPNEQTSVPLFTAGEVLTAANMNISAGTGVPVFATTVTRDAAFGGAGEKVLAEGQLAYIEASNVVQYYDGAAWATVGPSKVLQVVQGTTQTQVSTTSTSYVTTGLTATITPSSTSNLVLVSCSGTFSATFGLDAYATIFRGTVAGTNLGPAIGFNNIYIAGSTGTQNLVASASYLDNPATVSAQTYTLGMKKSGSGTAFFATSNSLATMTLMEISA